ncbi:hypothetical protein HKD37_06G015064 [Glycine soja]
MYLRPPRAHPSSSYSYDLFLYIPIPRVTAGPFIFFFLFLRPSSSACCLSSSSYGASSSCHPVAQDIQNQEEVGEEDEAEQAHPLLDPHEDRQHHQVQREAPSLASHQAWILRVWLLGFSLTGVQSSPRRKSENAVAQDIQNQEEVGEEDEAEQAYPLLDPHEDRQHHQVQREAPSLASHQAWILRCLLCLGSVYPIN